MSVRLIRTEAEAAADDPAESRGAVVPRVDLVAALEAAIARWRAAPKPKQRGER